MTTLSAVVQLIDAYSRQPAVAASARFLLDDRPVLPLAKPQAFYAFVGLAAGRHRLHVASPGYFSQELSLDVPLDLSPTRSLADAIVPCPMEPGPLYPYPSQTTLVRGQVIDAHSGRPLAGVQVRAEYQDARQRARAQRSATSGPDHDDERRNDRYHGRYAVALPGRLSVQTVAVLHFSLPGYAPSERRVALLPGATQFLDVELSLQPAGTP